MARRTHAQHNPDLLTADEAAAMLGLGRASIYAAVRRGEIPHRRVGRKILFSRRALQRWLALEDSASDFSKVVEAPP